MAKPRPAAARPRVALFVTCMVDTFYPEVGLAAVELLQRHGAEVTFPLEQSCCGQPAFNAGHRGTALEMARRFLDVFGPPIESGEIDAIVAPSGSCVAMVKHHFCVLLHGASEDVRVRAAAVGAACYELTQYLVDVLGVSTHAARFDGVLTYHPCCHLLRELNVDRQPRRLLAQLRGARLVELSGADECCGFGGLFALKNAEISVAMGRRKVRNLEASGAEAIAVCDVSCMTQLNGLLRRQRSRCRAVHIAELLAAAGENPDDVEGRTDAG